MAKAPLTVLRGGINRLRDKGGARADSLYDLVNGFLTATGSVVVRPGTTRTHTLDAATKGLVAYDGKFHTFSHQSVAVPTGYVLHVLVNPAQDPGDPVIALKTIHFAKPFLQYLYVVAEFEDNTVYHYWLQGGTTWAPNTVYKFGDLAQPTVVNGLAYEAARNGPSNPLWKANAPRAIGDKVEPTTANGFYYEVVDTAGATPASGDTEPNWPTEVGAQIVESTDLLDDSSDTDSTDPTNIPGSGTEDRYGD